MIITALNSMAASIAIWWIMGVSPATESSCFVRIRNAGATGFARATEIKAAVSTALAEPVAPHPK
jgi:hypothetical protein